MPQRKASQLVLTKFEAGVRYYHSVDEKMFFEWLASIPCVKSYAGEGSNVWSSD